MFSYMLFTSFKANMMTKKETDHRVAVYCPKKLQKP